MTPLLPFAWLTATCISRARFDIPIVIFSETLLIYRRLAAGQYRAADAASRKIILTDYPLIRTNTAVIKQILYSGITFQNSGIISPRWPHCGCRPLLDAHGFAVFPVGLFVFLSPPVVCQAGFIL